MPSSSTAQKRPLAAYDEKTAVCFRINTGLDPDALEYPKFTQRYFLSAVEAQMTVDAFSAKLCELYQATFIDFDREVQQQLVSELSRHQYLRDENNQLYNIPEDFCAYNLLFGLFTNLDDLPWTPKTAFFDRFPDRHRPINQAFNTFADWIGLAEYRVPEENLRDDAAKQRNELALQLPTRFKWLLGGDGLKLEQKQALALFGHKETVNSLSLIPWQKECRQPPAGHRTTQPPASPSP